MTGGREELPDSRARRRAVTDFESNLVVLAGAGTGKTSLLVERMLNALGLGAVEIDGLAAITFTEKAAGEMRERLSAGLDRLRALCRHAAGADAGRDETGAHEPDEADRAFAELTARGVPPQDVARRSLAAMESLDRARVSTIHGFCGELLREHPVEANVDPGFVVDSGEAAAKQKEEDWEAFLGRELGHDPPRRELWTRVLSERSLSEVRDIAWRLAGFDVPAQTLGAPIAVHPAEELLRDEMARWVADIDALLVRQRGMTDRTVLYFRELRGAFDAVVTQGLDAFRHAAHAGIELGPKMGGVGAPTPNKKLEGVSPREMKELSAGGLRLAKRLDELEDEALARVAEAVGPFALEFRERYLARGLVDFDGLLGLARDLLRNFPTVRGAIKRRYRMVLVDEFQDTDPVQHEIVLLLGEVETESATNPWEARLGPGRLFVVGDAKQSIYRFRGADYASYRRAVERITVCGGARLDLSASFRSVPEIVNAVNRLFLPGSTCWSPSREQPEYVPIDAVRGPATESPAVELWTVNPGEGARADERRDAEGRALAEAIEVAVRDKQCRYRDITVLLRAFTNLTRYLRALRERNIPFVVDGGKEFLDRPEVRELLATLRTLAHPADEPALLAFLRSPAGAVSDVDLADFAAAGGRWDWRTEPEPARHPRIAASFSLLRGLRDETRWLPADAVVRRVLERTALLPLSAVAFEGAQRVANLRKLAAAAAELARDGHLALDEVVDALAEGRLEDIRTDRPLSDDAAEAVRITSIHRMKGLENRWIFLADVARAPATGPRDPDVAAVMTLPDGRLALALRAGKATNAASVLRDLDDGLHETAEEVRVLYVALTRARERLVVIAAPTAGTPPWIEALAPWGYDPDSLPADGALLCDGLVLHRNMARLPSRLPVLVRVPERAGDAVLAWHEAIAAARKARPPLVAPSGAEDGEPPARATRGGNAVTRDLGRAVGIVMHRLLERPAGDAAALRDALATCVAEAAESEGVEAGALAAEAGELLETFLASELSRTLAGVEVLGREVPMLLARPNGGAYRGSIDLVYRDRDGSVAIADFKTDRETDDGLLARRHGAQLGIYAEAVTRALALERPPRKELWLLRGGRRLVLES